MMKKLNDVFDDVTNNGIFSGLRCLSQTNDWEWLNDYQSLNLEYHILRFGNRYISELVDNLIKNRINEKLNADDIIILSNVIYNHYGLKWEKLYDTLFLEYNPIENYDSYEEESPAETTETITPAETTETTTPAETTETTTPAETTETITPAETETKNNIYGFNSSVSVPSNEGQISVTTDGKTVITVDNDGKIIHTTETAGTNKITVDESGVKKTTTDKSRTLHRHGNIGVTTSQQMLQSERDLWKWEFLNTVFDDINKIITLPIL